MQPNKPRILFLLTTSDWGGAQFFVHSAAREAKRLGFTVMVAAGGEGELESRCVSAGIRYAKLTRMRRELSPLFDMAALHELRVVIRDFTPDVVHLNSSKMGVIGSMAAELERVPRVIYRIGGWSFLEDISSLKRWIYLTAEQWSAPKKDVIVTVHPGDEKIAKEKNIRPRGKILTIPNGIDLASFDRTLLSRDEARRKLELSPDTFVVGTIANFYSPKNLPWYLDTVAELAPTIPNVRFVIIGDGPDRKLIASKIKEHRLENIVSLIGRRADASALLRAFDLFVLPSTKEGMPWALLEAMATELPCIATNVGACNWMLESDAGVIVPVNDKVAIIDAIRKIQNDPALRTSLGKNARHAVEQRFRWETTLKQTLELFE